MASLLTKHNWDTEGEKEGQRERETDRKRERGRERERERDKKRERGRGREMKTGFKQYLVLSLCLPRSIIHFFKF